MISARRLCCDATRLCHFRITELQCKKKALEIKILINARDIFAHRHGYASVAGARVRSYTQILIKESQLTPVFIVLLHQYANLRARSDQAVMSIFYQSIGATCFMQLLRSIEFSICNCNGFTRAICAVKPLNAI